LCKEDSGHSCSTVPTDRVSKHKDNIMNVYNSVKDKWIQNVYKYKIQIMFVSSGRI